MCSVCRCIPRRSIARWGAVACIWSACHGFEQRGPTMSSCLFSTAAAAASGARSTLRGKESAATQAQLIANYPLLGGDCGGLTDDAPPRTSSATATASIPEARRGTVLEALVGKGESLVSVRTENRMQLLVASTSPLPLFINPATHSKVAKEGKHLIPTLFACWRAPIPFLSVIRVPYPVAAAVLRGADVMWPGVVTDPPTPGAPAYREGDVVAVAVIGNPSPFAIGYVQADESVAASGSLRGKGVLILHHYRDGLWSAVATDTYASGEPLIPNPGFRRNTVTAWPCTTGSLAPHGDSDDGDGGSGAAVGGGIGAGDMSRRLAHASFGEAATSAGAGVASLIPTSVASASSSSSGHGGVSGSTVSAGDTKHAPTAVAGGDGDGALVAMPPDELVMATLLQALKRHIKDRDLPLLVSALWPLMQACRPQGTVLDIKRTQWKKLGGLLAHVSSGSSPLLLLRPVDDKGVSFIDRINRHHDELMAFKPWPKHVEAAAAASGGGGEDTEDTDVPATALTFHAPVLIEAYSIPPCAMPLMRQVSRYVSAGLCAATLRLDGVPADAAKRGEWDAVRYLISSALPPDKSKGPQWARRLVDMESSGKGGPSDTAVFTPVPSPMLLYPLPTLKAALREYIDVAKRVYQPDKRKVCLDDILADAITGSLSKDTRVDTLPTYVFPPTGSLGSGSVVAKHMDASTAMPREQLNGLWVERLQAHWLLVFPLDPSRIGTAIGSGSGSSGKHVSADTRALALSGSLVEVVYGRGSSPPLILIHVRALHGGKKHMTHIAGLDAFRLDPATMAKEFSRRFAASSSVTTAGEAGWVPTGCPATSVLVQVQGDESAAVRSFLVNDLHISSRCVHDTHDSKAKSKGKGGGGGGKK